MFHDTVFFYTYISWNIVLSAIYLLALKNHSKKFTLTYTPTKTLAVSQWISHLNRHFGGNLVPRASLLPFLGAQRTERRETM